MIGGLIRGKHTNMVAASNFSMEGGANCFLRGGTRKFAYKLTINSLNANSIDRHKIAQKDIFKACLIFDINITYCIFLFFQFSLFFKIPGRGLLLQPP